MEVAILILALLLVWVVVTHYFDGEGMVWASLFVVLIWVMWFTRDSPAEAAVKDARKATERLARETPHVVREADGCKVYAFERHGRDHYFTRCPATTDTETNWKESCGKNCTRHKSENIVTENAQ